MEEVEPVVLPKPEAQHFLKLSAHCLSVRDFSGCRNNALLAGELDSSLPEVEQILAVVHVLLAGERCFDDHLLDWYAILQVHPMDSDNEKLVQSQVIKLLILLNPIKNKFAFSTEAYDLVLDAWSVLSDPLKKSRFDNEVIKIGGSRESENVCEFVETFWTVCPYCYYAYEYERVYADCCLRCMNCENAFYGAAINGPPPQTAILDGKEHYGCWLGDFKMYYRGDMNVEGNKKLRAQGAIFSTFTEISDDDHDYNGSSKELPDAHCHGRTWNIDPVEKKMKCGNEMNNKRGEGTGVMDSKDVKFSEDYASEKENACEFVETFWTVCPYCYYVYEYERVYADCCLRCMNCENAFHAAAINGPPPQAVILDGKEHYGCWLGSFKMHYRGEMNVEGNKKLRAEGAIFSTFIEISDDDHDYYESSKEPPDAHRHGRTGSLDPVENKIKCGNEMNSKRGEGTGVMDSNDVKFSDEMGGLEFYKGDDVVHVGLSDV